MPALETDFAEELKHDISAYKAKADQAKPIFDYVDEQQNLTSRLLTHDLTGPGAELLKRFVSSLKSVNTLYHRDEKAESVETNTENALAAIDNFLHVSKRFNDWANLTDVSHPSVFSLGETTDLEQIQGLDLLADKEDAASQRRTAVISSVQDLLVKARNEKLTNKASKDLQPVIDDTQALLEACKEYADQETNLVPLFEKQFLRNPGAVARQAIKQVDEPPVSTVQPIENITAAHLLQNKTVDSFYFTETSDYIVTEKEASVPGQVQYRNPLLHVVIMPNTNPPKPGKHCFQVNIKNHLKGLSDHPEEKTVFDKKSGQPGTSDVRRIAAQFSSFLDDAPAVKPLLAQGAWTSDQKLTDYQHDESPMRLRLDKLETNVGNTTVSSMNNEVRVKIHVLPHGRPAC